MAGITSPMVKYIDAVSGYLAAQAGFALQEATVSQMMQVETKLAQQTFTVESAHAIATAIRQLPLSTTDQGRLLSALNSRVGLHASRSRAEEDTKLRLSLQRFEHCHHFFRASLWGTLLSASESNHEARGSRQNMTYPEFIWATFGSRPEVNGTTSEKNKFERISFERCSNERELNLMPKPPIESFWDALWLGIKPVLCFIVECRRIVLWRAQTIEN